MKVHFFISNLLLDKRKTLSTTVILSSVSKKRHGRATSEVKSSGTIQLRASTKVGFPSAEKPLLQPDTPAKPGLYWTVEQM